MLTDFKNSFAGTLSRKFAMKPWLKIPGPQACICACSMQVHGQQELLAICCIYFATVCLQW